MDERKQIRQQTEMVGGGMDGWLDGANSDDNKCMDDEWIDRYCRWIDGRMDELY